MSTSDTRRAPPAPAGPGLRRAWPCYGAALAVFAAGLALAAAAYPAGFDWPCMVVSRLASRKHNPDGSLWFSLGLAVAMLLLWPVMDRVRPGTGLGRGGRFAGSALRAGIVFACLVGLERALFVHVSDRVDKGHEAIALLAFLSLYVGLLGTYASRLRAGTLRAWPALPSLVPLVGVGVANLALYLLQRDVGWVKPNWRELGVPVWQSFAFWQWLTVAALWAAVAHLLAMTPRADAQRLSRDGGPSLPGGRVTP